MTKINYPKNTKEVITEILQKREFSKLIGLSEDIHFDAKKGLPKLKEKSQKIEFAKDITSFANLNGGYLIYGLETDEAKTNQLGGGEITLVRGIKSYSLKQIKDIIINKIYPNISPFIKIQKYELKNEKYLLSIYIESNKKKPFFVYDAGLLDTGKNSKLNIGYFERKFDQSESSITIREIYQMFKKDNLIESKIDYLIDLTKTGLNEKTKKSNKNTDRDNSVKNELKKKRIREALQEEPFLNNRALVLYSEWIPESKKIEGLFSGENGVFSIVKNPPFFRRLGWDLRTLSEPKIIEGKYLEAKAKDTKILRVYRDGSILFICLANPEFLAFGYHEDEKNQEVKKIRALSTAEVIANFSTFFTMLKAFVNPKPKKIITTIALSNPNKEKIKLVKGFLNTIDIDNWVGEVSIVSKQYVERMVEVEIVNEGNFDWEKIAYDLYIEFCLIFGVSENKIWFTKNKKIDLKHFSK